MRDGHVVLLAVLVDDVFIACGTATVISRVKADFKAQFTVTDMGKATEFLGVLITSWRQGPSGCETNPSCESGLSSRLREVLVAPAFPSCDSGVVAAPCSSG